VLQKSQVENYFFAEKTEAAVFLVVGVLAMATAVILSLWLKSKWSFGFAIPLIIIAAVQIAVGWTVYSHSDRLRTDVVYAMDLDPAFIKNTEIPRMQKVMRNFSKYRFLELLVACVGIVLILLFSKSASVDYAHGIGCGLLLQALLLLLLDFFAERRAAAYLQQLIAWANA
jgi:hypothetical protein